MISSVFLGWFLYILHGGLQLFFIARALLRPHREPSARLAWVVVIAVAPVVGMIAYVLFGDASIGQRRIARERAALKRLPALAQLTPADEEGALAEKYVSLFRLGRSINGYPAVEGNSARLLPDSASTIAAIIADVDAAQEHVHLLFYIWLTDGSGLALIDAVKRAATRGVVCRVMVDDLGSRALIRSPYWTEMATAGVRLASALPIGNPLLRPFKGRIDMRNHRKIVVVDNRITYCGSQNVADAAFAVKARYAPWVDAMMRFEGPVVRQNQHLFAGDWMSHMPEDLSELLRHPMPEAEHGFVAQVIGTGAAVRYSSMPDIFVAVMSTAMRELVITTPYFVPDEPILAALCASARRGVRTVLVVPQRNDSRIVAAASRSYYRTLLDAGVEIHEYVGGLLHTKSITVDGECTLIGSANMDRRSFELNSENNILLCDVELTAAMRRRQQSYIEHAGRVDRDTVARWSRPRQLWNNSIAMLGPVL